MFVKTPPRQMKLCDNYEEFTPKVSGRRVEGQNYKIRRF